MFVQPSEHWKLSEFCTELTGITQVEIKTILEKYNIISMLSRGMLCIGSLDCVLSIFSSKHTVKHIEHFRVNGFQRQ